jgi:hypothetical protein
MAHTSREPSGVLVVRAWVEGGPPIALRARIMQLSDLDEHQLEAVAASLEQILAIVRGWLEGLQAAAQPPPTANGTQSGDNLRK